MSTIAENAELANEQAHKQTQVDAHEHEHEHDNSEMNLLGFWIYIMSDCLIFACIFATYAVLHSNFAGLARPSDVFDLKFVFVETMLLLVSSFTFGRAMLGANQGNMAVVKKWLTITFFLGLGFIGMELYEFHHFVSIGITPKDSAYWSAFFTLVGTHGLHVTAGLIWMIVMAFHLKRDGLDKKNVNRLSMLSLFWHFLDIIWICVFSFVYLIGSFS